MIRVALIGCGAVSRRYYEVFILQGIPNAKVVAVCDILRDQANTLAKKMNVVPYYDIVEMLGQEQPDLVFILTPSGSHYEHSRIALEHGCHTITEKPISLRLAHSRELVVLSRRKKLMYGVVLQNRYNKAIQFLKSQLDEGVFGKRVLSTIRLRWCRDQDYYADGWHGTWVMDGGVIAQQAIHHLDILQWLGGEIKRVCSSCTSTLNTLEADDTSVVIMEFAGGSLGVIEATTAARPIDCEASISIVAEGGLAEIGGIALNRIIQWNLTDISKDSKKIMDEHSEDVPNGFGFGHEQFLQDVISRLLEGNTEAPISPNEGLKSLQLVHAIYKSSETNSWVNLKDNPRSQLLGK